MEFVVSFDNTVASVAWALTVFLLGGMAISKRRTK
jgi:hypothetical protein